MKLWLTGYSRGILILLLTASAAWAQATAQMSGTVRDESGAVLPGVTVTVTQIDTSVMRTAVTDEAGAYLLPNLPTGPYRRGGVSPGIPHLRADRHRPAGWRDADDQRRAGGRQRRRNGHLSRAPHRSSTSAARGSATSSRTSRSCSCRSTAATRPSSC